MVVASADGAGCLSIDKMRDTEIVYLPYVLIDPPPRSCAGDHEDTVELTAPTLFKDASESS